MIYPSKKVIMQIVSQRVWQQTLSEQTCFFPLASSSSSTMQLTHDDNKKMMTSTFFIFSCNSSICFKINLLINERWMYAPFFNNKDKLNQRDLDPASLPRVIPLPMEPDRAHASPYWILLRFTCRHTQVTRVWLMHACSPITVWHN